MVNLPDAEFQFRGFRRMGEWVCTAPPKECGWKGIYDECNHVMYNQIDWEQCPKCKSVAIPKKGIAAYA